MIIILKQTKRQPFTEQVQSLSSMIDGVIVGTDIEDVRRQVAIVDSGLAGELYGYEGPIHPKPGKYELRTPGYLMLVT